MERLRLIEHNPASGAVKYEGNVSLGEGRMLTFHVKGATGTNGNPPWVELKFEAYEGETFEHCMRRMGDWLEAAARPFRGVAEPGPVQEWCTKPAEEEIDDATE